MTSNDIDHDPGLVSPFSTGGGGYSFEYLVGASYLLSLLAGDIPRGLNRGITQSVAFQQRWAGSLCDDIVIYSTDENHEYRLALQVKHDLRFSETDNDFRKVISDCWKTFTGEYGFDFNQDLDRLGIAVGVYHQAIAKHLQSLLDWARSSITAEEFFRKVEVANFSSDDKRRYLQVLRNTFNEAAGREISKEELWSLLRCFVVLHFDLLEDGSRDLVNSRSRLLDLLVERDEGRASQLFILLIDEARRNALSSGTLNYESLRSRLHSITFRDRPDFARDINKLRNHSDRTLNHIKSQLGRMLNIPREGLLDSIVDATSNYRVLIISGEPGTGKSALAKMLLEHL